MIIQATSHGTAAKEEPFAFTYSGSFVDERDSNGIGDVTLNTSGQLVTSGKTVRVTVYILGAGGGGVSSYGSSKPYRAGGGSGGQQTVEVELIPGTYEVIIGTGGAGAANPGGAVTGGTGGDTFAFGCTSTGGEGGYAKLDSQAIGGTGGEPNGTAGSTLISGTGTAAGGSPNGGDSTFDGGDGLVRITFS